jgi:hypothetical protein
MALKNNDPRLTTAYKRVRLQVLARDNHTCRYCQGQADTVDHLIALKNGGDPLDPENMAAACRKCNSSKGARIAPFFLGSTSTPYASPASISPTRSKTIQDSPFTVRPDPS